ncbi:putative NADH-ubiquinone oxidoreductase 39 kDa subunit [Taphrina deformans PYCC 5710]|uniref:NADH-ubiquinone oxidoreductase 39 kDa subunit n=1 Tax=Taphrina deformans (strain PYCC 5710 / ATCC 11124 / CBS 356.35 / IMI 108563 / JCM 9778 / NBRC 8474) TaxID=1097556 RepID=R4X6F9_TAPDE|nr:putative NADH-ubiquinone oxidoreductase 39 kDa subunit [Taphrina deformans PYCC 5710]|eukprot:CCG80684.1 putative NADH-ubiquinone oxidoreductase 39 kDa subunit [Taphrina deformans PYCC 5710]
MKHGPGGRSSSSGHTATVFGATGFLGRYLVAQLAKQGTQVVVPYRDDFSKRHLKVNGDLGQISMMEFDLRNRQCIEESVKHSNIVYNLIGRDYETKNFSFDAVHHQATQRIAEACAKYDVDRFVQVSAIGADENSPSQFLRTKALAEKAATNIYPETTIVRPAAMYGLEDRFMNSLATATTLLTTNHMNEIVRPTYVRDVARALESMMHNDETTGQLYELHSQQAFKVSEICDMISEITLKEPRHYNVPKVVLQSMAKVLEKVLWWNIIGADEIERQSIDEKLTPGAKGYKDLGIDAQELNMQTMKYLRMYRSNTYYSAPLDGTEGKIRRGPDGKIILHVTD